MKLFDVVDESEESFSAVTLCARCLLATMPAWLVAGARENNAQLPGFCEECGEQR